MGASQPSRTTGTSVCRVDFPDFTLLRRPRSCTVNRSNFTYTVSRACANTLRLRVYRLVLGHSCSLLLQLAALFAKLLNLLNLRVSFHIYRKQPVVHHSTLHHFVSAGLVVVTVLIDVTARILYTAHARTSASQTRVGSCLFYSCYLAYFTPVAPIFKSVSRAD